MDADRITDGAGADTCVFRDNAKRDRIRDFEAGTDTLRMDVTGVTGFNDLTIANNDKGVAVIQWNSSQVTLIGVDQTYLTADDFILRPVLRKSAHHYGPIFNNF